MNRIYQGKVTAVEISDGKDEPGKPLDLDVLWRHHELFQDAVNFWAFALAEMARGMMQKNDEGEDVQTPMAEFADKVFERWEDFSHKGTQREGLKHSLSRTLGLPLNEITWEKCAERIFAAVLEKFPGRKDSNGQDVLHGVIGELFRAGRGLAPKNMANEDPSWLCWRDKREKENTPATAFIRKTRGITGFMDELFWADAEGIKRVAQLPLADTFLTSMVTPSGIEPSSDDPEDDGDNQIEEVPIEDSAVNERVFFLGREAVTELEAYFKSAIELLKDAAFIRDFDLLGGKKFEVEAELARITKKIELRKQAIAADPESLCFQRWKKQGPKERDRDRVRLFVLLQFDEGSEFMGTMLRARLLRRKDSYIEHLHSTDKVRYVEFVNRFGLCGLASEGKEAVEKVKAARKAIASEVSTAANLSASSTDFIKTLRATVGYVFPSFTAIRSFVAEEGKAGVCQHGEMGWKKFDNAAYEEAVKAPHQIQKKKKERDADVKKLRAIEKLYQGEGRRKGGDDDDEGHTPGGFSKTGDPRFSAMERVREKLSVEDGVEPGKFYEYTISEAALRGYDELRTAWNKKVEAGEQFSPGKAAELQQVLKDHQTEHRDDVGAVRLFDEFLKEGNWCVWQNEKEDIEKERVAKNYSDNFVRDYLRFVEIVDERKRKQKPIQYTPADASESRRLFDFKGGAGLKHTEKAEELSFTTQIAVKCSELPNALYRTQDVRISYTAPRLLRDEARVLSESEDLKSANWAQPMMRALGIPNDSRHDFKTHAVSLMPDWHAGSRSLTPDRLLLNFVLMPKEDKFVESIRKQMGREKWPWLMQFNWNRDKHASTLRWPHEDWSKIKSKKKFPGFWFEDRTLTKFRFLAEDLGQKQAGAYALVEVSCRYSDEEKKKKHARFIGRIESNGDRRDWYAWVVLTGLHKLPGEDAEVLRPEFANGKPVPGTKGFREELSGSAGRNATDQESRGTFEYLKDSEQLELLDEDARTIAGVQKALTFPAQNTKMLIALRRVRTFANRLHRWCWFLAPTDEERKDQEDRRRTVIKEIAEADAHPWLNKKTHELAKEIHARVQAAQEKGEKVAVPADPRITVPIKLQLEKLESKLPGLLEIVANRIYASRKGRFVWGKNPDKDSCHLLDFVEFSKDELAARKAISKDEKRLAGQRGLSMERIEQLEELRKLCQSLNQTLRRPIGGKPPISRDDSIPDPCPKILAKLDEIKEQRRNQTAHMMLAEALGLKLAGPDERPESGDDAARKAQEAKDAHGEYVKVDDKGHAVADNDSKAWRGVVDFIVIEDLSRYLTSQGRAPRENSRLMKWCHRAIRDKLEQMCEPFGVLMVETPAAYSSRFCSRTGVAGFRATELSAASLAESKWKWKTRKPNDEAKEKPESKKRREQWESLYERLRKANESRDGKSKGQKFRTLLAPEAGGSVFVPMADLNREHQRPAKDPNHPKKYRPIIQYCLVTLEEGQTKEPRLIHSDINAAVSLALRAVASPRIWSIHSRLRSERESDAPPKPRNKKSKKEKDAQKAGQPLTEAKPDRFFVSESEKRKFRSREKPKHKTDAKTDAQDGDESKPEKDTRIKIELNDPKQADLKSSDSHHPNFFADFANLAGAHWGAAKLEGLEHGEPAPTHLVTGKALWGFIKGQTWKRCLFINAKRLQAWGITPPKEWELE
jgi:hypothetical protein